MKILMLGAPGAGKGTVAQKLVEKYKIPQVSTGDLLRSAVAAGTEIGRKAKAIMDAGKLVPDEVVIGLVRDRVKSPDCSEGFILDGFPRTIPQADAVRAFAKIDVVINLDVSDAIIIERLEARRTCRKCQAIYNLKNFPPKVAGKCDACGGELYQRGDDKREAILTRLDTYRKQTQPLVEYYRRDGVLRTVNGNVPLDQILKGVHDNLQPFLGKC
jgi:adenylate kinase